MRRVKEMTFSMFNYLNQQNQINDRYLEVFTIHLIVKVIMIAISVEVKSCKKTHFSEDLSLFFYCSKLNILNHLKANPEPLNINLKVNCQIN